MIIFGTIPVTTIEQPLTLSHAAYGPGSYHPIGMNFRDIMFNFYEVKSYKVSLNTATSADAFSEFLRAGGSIGTAISALEGVNAAIDLLSSLQEYGLNGITNLVDENGNNIQESNNTDKAFCCNGLFPYEIHLHVFGERDFSIKDITLKSITSRDGCASWGKINGNYNYIVSHNPGSWSLKIIRISDNVLVLGSSAVAHTELGEDNCCTDFENGIDGWAGTPLCPMKSDDNDKLNVFFNPCGRRHRLIQNNSSITIDFTELLIKNDLYWPKIFIYLGPNSSLNLDIVPQVTDPAFAFNNSLITFDGYGIEMYSLNLSSLIFGSIVPYQYF